MQTDSKPLAPSARALRQAMEGIRPRRAEHVLEYEVDNELALYDPRREQVHTLNTTAAMVWRLCDGTRTVQELAEDLSIIFDLPDVSPVQGDVYQMLQQFREARLLRKEEDVSDDCQGCP